MNDFENILVYIENFKVDKDHILEVYNNTVYNNTIINYYKRLSEDFNISSSKINNLSNCNKFWNVDVYYKNLTKDFISTNLCHDKFCNNCKKVKQASRMSRYIPEIEPYKNNLYHLTLTIPNVYGADLSSTLKKMSKCFRILIRYINCTVGCNFFDFSKLGYKGAIRSLEITFNNDYYHPHYHCAFVFENLNLDKKYKNIYSTDFYNNREDRLFSYFEIVVQKFWYMIWNDIRVNEKNFNNLDYGYSCICDKFYEDDYMELFKYMTKCTDENDNILSYENFKTLYNSTYFLKQIQGYGCFYRITDNNINDEINKLYSDIKDFLKLTDDHPEFKNFSLFDLLNDNNFTLISRKKIYQYLKNIK